MHRCPSLQFGVLLPNPIRNQRVISLHPLSVSDRMPIICAGVIAVGEVKYDGGGCENEAFEGGVLTGGLENGERPGDGGFDYCF